MTRRSSSPLTIRAAPAAIAVAGTTSSAASRDASRRVSAVAQLVVLIGGEAGLRAGEMRALQWADVDFTRRQLRVARSEWRGHLTATKGGRVRYVLLTRRLAAALEAAQRGTRKADEVLKPENGLPFRESHVADPGQGGARRDHAAARAAYPPPHVLLAPGDAGAAVGAIQLLAGHQDLLTTQRYMHLSPNMLDDAIRLLDAAGGGAKGCGDIVETLSGVSAGDGSRKSKAESTGRRRRRPEPSG